MNYPDLFATFTQERHYLRNVRPKTLAWYAQSFAAFRPFLQKASTERELKAALKRAVLSMVDSGKLSTTSINAYSRCLNAFLNWLHKEGHVSERIRIEKLNEKQRLIQTLTDQEVERVVRFKPKGVNLRRVHVAALTVLDCGLRANEVRQLRREDVDFDNLLVNVEDGKGGHQRIVPMSNELRRILYRYVQKNGHRGASEYIYATSWGSPVLMRNFQRDLKTLGRNVGIEHIHFHLLRHTMATRYLRSGGSLAVLRRILGHSSITTTMIYEHLQTRDLKAEHSRHSLLAQVR